VALIVFEVVEVVPKPLNFISHALNGPGQLLDFLLKRFDAALVSLGLLPEREDRLR